MQGCSESLLGSSEAAGFPCQKTLGDTENCKEKATTDHKSELGTKWQREDGI